MAVKLQYTESNLIGYLAAAITLSATTITARFYDKVTGELRAPDANTQLFVIDKGTEAAPNPQYEIVYTPNGWTTLAGVSTATGCVRGLAFTGSDLSAGTGKAHVGQAEIGPVDVHYLWNEIVATLKGVGDMIRVPIYANATARDAAVTSPATGNVCYLTDVASFSYYVGSAWVFDKTIVFANTTARDAAIPSPANGMSCYVTADGVFYDYQAGSWQDRANGATPVATEAVLGKMRVDVAPAVAGDPVAPGLNSTRILGSNSASTANTISLGSVTPANQATALNLIADTTYTAGGFRATRDGTSGGANAVTTLTHRGTGDFIISAPENADILASTTGLFKAKGPYAWGGVAGETLAYGDWVYVKASDGKLYKGDYSTVEKASIVGVITEGGSANDTVYFQNGGVFTTTGLSPNVIFWLSNTAGAYTVTVPSFVSSAVVPVYLGISLSTTQFLINIQRRQRRVFFQGTRAVADGNGTQTLTAGFPLERAEFSARRTIADASELYGSSTGYYDAVANLNWSEGSTTYCLNIQNTTVAGSLTAVASQSGNNVVLTWTATGANTTLAYTGVIYELF